MLVAAKHRSKLLSSTELGGWNPASRESWDKRAPARVPVLPEPFIPFLHIPRASQAPWCALGIDTSAYPSTLAVAGWALWSPLEFYPQAPNSAASVMSGEGLRSIGHYPWSWAGTSLQASLLPKSRLSTGQGLVLAHLGTTGGQMTRKGGLKDVPVGSKPPRTYSRKH